MKLSVLEVGAICITLPLMAGLLSLCNWLKVQLGAAQIKYFWLAT